MERTEIAEAFSRHRFAETYPHLHEDVRWDVVGDRLIVGRAAVRETCGQSAEYLSGVRTTFRRFRVVAGGDQVVVDSEAEYAGDGEPSVVASCDLYDFTGGLLSGITSYTIELGARS